MSDPRSSDPVLLTAPGGPEDGYEPVHLDDAATELVETAEEVEPEVESQPPAPPPKRAAVNMPQVAQVTDADRDFLQRVFLQVRDVDFRAPPPPPPRRDLAGPDKKIASLRQSMFELERDMARVAYVWGAMQQQYEVVDQLVKGKEAERDSAVARYNQLRDLAAQTAARDRGEIDALKKRVAELEARGAALENELTQQAAQANARLQKAEQEKAALLADFRAKMESAQTAFNQLREQSTRAMTDLEGRIKKRDEELTQRAQEADASAAAAAEHTREIARLQGELARRDESLKQLQAERDRQETAIAERSKNLSVLTEELSRLRSQHETALVDLRASLKLKDELMDSTRNEVKSARAEFTQLAEAYEARRVELEKATAEIAALRAELDKRGSAPAT
jgi:chromosome segregation ATPase